MTGFSGSNIREWFSSEKNYKKTLTDNIYLASFSEFNMTYEVFKTKLPEVLILTPKIFKDTRGYFFESFRNWIEMRGNMYSQK